RARVPARGDAGAEGRRAPALHAHDRGAARSRHRRIARRATRQDTLLERVQATRPLVGRAPALLTPRVLAFGVLAVALGLYYGFHESLPNTSTWGDVAFLALLLIPAVLGLVYLVLPLRAARELELLLVALAFPVPGEASAANLGLPDVLFFSLFLAAAARFGLRVFVTWLLLAASFGATIAIAVAWNKPGLPALPLLSLAFLLANGDLLWRAFRQYRGDVSAGSSRR